MAGTTNQIQTPFGTGVRTALGVSVNGSGAISLTTSPTFVTPVLGAASATSVAFTSTSGIIGTTTNNSAAAGSVGEIISSAVNFSSPVTGITTGSVVNITSVSLTAGQWVVTGSIGILSGAATTLNAFFGWISSTSATFPSNNREITGGVSYGGAAIVFGCSNHTVIIGLNNYHLFKYFTTFHFSEYRKYLWFYICN